MENNTIIEKPKRKFRFDLIILIILLVGAGIIISYFLKSPTPVGKCNSNEDCGAYNVFYMKGDGYVCANKEIVQDNSIKTKVLMFKYASKKATPEKPVECSCIQSQCEAN